MGHQGNGLLGGYEEGRRRPVFHDNSLLVCRLTSYSRKINVRFRKITIHTPQKPTTQKHTNCFVLGVLLIAFNKSTVFVPSVVAFETIHSSDPFMLLRTEHCSNAEKKEENCSSSCLISQKQEA